jgi:hypothetical protein
MLGLSRPRCLERARTPAAEHVVLAWKIRVQQWLGQSASRMRRQCTQRRFTQRQRRQRAAQRETLFQVAQTGPVEPPAELRLARAAEGQQLVGLRLEVREQADFFEQPRGSVPNRSPARSDHVAAPCPAHLLDSGKQPRRRPCRGRTEPELCGEELHELGACQRRLFRYVGGKHLAAKNGCDVCGGDKLVVAEPATADLRGDVDLIV